MKQASKNFFNSFEDVNFKFSEFSGPLDLLLKLIQNKKIDILSISLSELTDQYLNILSEMLKSDINIAGEYLSMASYFIKRKSNYLLPNPEEDIDIEEEERLEKWKLIQRLYEYQKYKDLAPVLEKKFDEKSHNFSKKPENIDFLQNYYNQNIKYRNDYIDYKDLDIEQIYEAMSAFWNRNLLKNKKMTMLIEEIDPLERQKEILESLNKNNEPISLKDNCKGFSVRYLLVTFLAILEMAMKGLIFIKKSKNNDDIIMIKR